MKEEETVQKPVISIMVAISANNVIGSEGQMPWNQKNDLQRFARLTKESGWVIVGRKTQDEMVKKLKKSLPHRTTIVITRFPEYPRKDCTTAHSFEEALKLAKEAKEIFVIGGAEVYMLALPYANKLYITKIEGSVDGDTYFPPYDRKDWHLVSQELFSKDNDNDYDYAFEVYERKNSEIINNEK